MNLPCSLRWYAHNAGNSKCIFVFVFIYTDRQMFVHSFQMITSPVILVGGETWSLTLREDVGLGVWEQRLKRVLGP
jgi:hypothetical protein